MKACCWTLTFWAWVLLSLLGGVEVLMAAEDRQALEESFFNQPEAIIQTPTPVPTATTLAADTKTIGFSGEIQSVLADTISRSVSANSFYSFTVADVFLDARLPRQAKVFANLEAILYSQTSTTEVALREVFFDFNLRQAVYFRTGKQVLQWGRCYLWNPTDLINIEQPSFIRKIGSREGAYGLKFHVPSGVGFNFYGFMDTGKAVQAEKTAIALKTEFLVNNWEMAFSGWGKQGFHPVWGYDFSTRLLGIDLAGEVSLSQGDIRPRMQIQAEQLELSRDSQALRSQACLDLGRGFTIGNFQDRLTLILETYYNQAGYTDNVFADPTVYTFHTPVEQIASSGIQTITTGTKRDFFYYHQLHELNHLSPWYIALFSRFSRFVLTDMTLSFNYIRNLLDYSSILSLGLDYVELNGFGASLLTNAFLGPADREYTYSGEKYNLQLILSLSF